MSDLPTSSATDDFLSSLHVWLGNPRATSVGEEFIKLCDYLHSIQAHSLSIQKRASILDKIYVRSMSAVQTLRLSLTDIPLPISGKIRQTIRDMQEMLDILARNLVDLGDAIDNKELEASTTTTLDLILWRSLYAISRHIVIGSLVASPPKTGAWRQLHQIYDHACLRKLNRNTPAGTTRSLLDVYYTAVLLGCAQPASFTSAEVDFLECFLECISNQIDLNDDGSDPVWGVFWIDPESDTPAIPCARKSPPSGIPIRFFSCERLSALLKIQLTKLEAGASPEQVNLPKFAATPAGLGTLRRLIQNWGDPAKRRFPRRRQNYQGELCIGLSNICQLLQKTGTPPKVSNWMVTCESPDGYTVMHDSGKIAPLRRGDVTALRTENNNNWQICIIRRVLSENMEHIELGLQILSTRFFAAQLALSSKTGGIICQPAIFLPSIPTLRPEEMLVLSSETLANSSKDLVLIIEKDNIEVREINAKYNHERNGQIEIYAIESDLPEETK